MTARSAVLGLLASALAALLGFAAPVQAGMLWGVNGHPLEAYRVIEPEEQVRLLAELGARSYRVDVTNTDRAEALDRLVQLAGKQGIAILPILIPPVDWDHDEPARIRATALAFAKSFGTRFRGRIPVWELGNEMENEAILRPCDRKDDGSIYPCDWGAAGGLGPTDYRGAKIEQIVAVLQGLSEGLRQTDPAARQAVGSAGWGHIGFFDRLWAAGVRWDISVWHLYGEDPEWAFKRLAAFGRPIWITEFNHPYGSAKDGEAGQRDGLLRWMRRFQELAPTYRVEAAFIYELMDESYWGEDFEAKMGLVHLDPARSGDGQGNGLGKWRVGKPKAAFEAVRDFWRKDS